MIFFADITQKVRKNRSHRIFAANATPPAQLARAPGSEARPLVFSSAADGSQLQCVVLNFNMFFAGKSSYFLDIETPSVYFSSRNRHRQIGILPVLRVRYCLMVNDAGRSGHGGKTGKRIGRRENARSSAYPRRGVRSGGGRPFLFPETACRGPSPAAGGDHPQEVSQFVQPRGEHVGETFPHEAGTRRRQAHFECTPAVYS